MDEQQYKEEGSQRWSCIRGSTITRISTAHTVRNITSTYTLGGGLASHADDAEVLGLEVVKGNGTDCESRA
jgi:hypothetical protein